MTTASPAASNQSQARGSSCRFCGLASSPLRAESETVLFETERFEVWPSLGGFIEGWLLVLPKFHALSLSDLHSEQLQELQTLVTEVKVKVGRVYGPVVLAEHGPAVQSSAVGCGIDHAHLHVIPTTEPVVQLAREAFPALSWESVTGLAEVQNRRLETGLSYVYLEEGDEAVASFAPTLPSQLIRRILAPSVGASSFDWREAHELDRLERTVARLLGTQ